MEETLYAPTQVLEVHAAMMCNARERWSEEDVQAIKPVYTRAEDRWDNETNEYETTGNWIVGCNFEGWGPSMIFKEGVWFYRSRVSGEDSPMKGGHEEALGNAQIFFTG